ncbi:hypothetical protein [Curvibacter fontanus]
MNAHGRSEAFIPQRTARRIHMNAHGRSEAFIPQRTARRAPQ